MRADDLKTAIESYEKLIANYSLARSRIIERRQNASDNVMVELDERLEANARTVAALRRALEISRAQLKLIEEGRA